jgi:hypothetical protein
MADKKKDDRKPAFTAEVRFAGIAKDEAAPQLAVYEVDTLGRPTRKLARAERDQLEVSAEWEKLPGIALGPDVDDPSMLSAENVVQYRFDTIAPVWQEGGIVVGRNVWDRFFLETVCVGGRPGSAGRGGGVVSKSWTRQPACKSHAPWL